MARVGILAFLQESNTFLSGKTTFEHFQQDLLLLGEDVRQGFASAHHEVRGFFDGLSHAGIDAVPIFAARAYPFGTIDSGAFERLVCLMLSELQNAGRMDGLLVAPHGATVSDSYPDADGRWLTLVRQAVGPQMPIVGTLDPHGNLSREMITATDALVSYRTNPHLDQSARGREAADLMTRILQGELQPTQAACFPPMAINIERQCTAEQPLSDVVTQFEIARTRPNVISASLMLGFPYADVAEMGSSALVVTDNNPELAQSVANELGSAMWAQREALAGSFLSVEEAVLKAKSLSGPICLLDMGDNVGGGSPANGTWLVHELRRQNVGPAFVCLNDAEAVEQITRHGVGSKLWLSLGSRDALHGPPLESEFRVTFLGDGRFTEEEARHGGIATFDQGRTAIVESEDRRLVVMLTSRRVPPFSLRQLTSCGIDPFSFHVLIAKGVNAPLAAYQPVCANILRVNTRGVTMADMTQLSYHHRRNPLFPFERETCWVPSTMRLETRQ